MSNLITGIHHITAMASDPQKNLDFYGGILGLRLLKKTINFDAPEIYHLYYGNESGDPGTILTFFPYTSIPPGRKGTGQLSVTSFSIPASSLSYWMGRLDKFQIKYKVPEKRFDETVIYFEDYDGLGLELVANSNDERDGFTYGNIPKEHAIKGFFGITLLEECYEKTAKLLTSQMNYVLVKNQGNRFRFSTDENPSSYVDILCSPDALRGVSGYGTIHHVAFATADEASQILCRDRLLKYGLNITPVIDREYFHSIYFREPGSVLFEIATMQPGFAVDEPLEHLGESLKLPPWQEINRQSIENILPSIKLDLKKFSD